MDKHSFCESVTATGISPWCIRPLTDQGRKLSGGVDTASLCGRVQPPHGWDIGLPVSLTHWKICEKCRTEYDKQAAEAARGGKAKP